MGIFTRFFGVFSLDGIQLNPLCMRIDQIGDNTEPEICDDPLSFGNLSFFHIMPPSSAFRRSLCPVFSSAQLPPYVGFSFPFCDL